MKTFGRRTISIIMSVIMVLSCFAGLTFSVGAEASGESEIGNEEKTNGDYNYIVLDDGTVEITAYNATCKGTLEIPSEIDGKKVTSIGEYSFANGGDNSISFMNMYTITELIIPNSVTDIKDAAFADLLGVNKITLPENLVSIGSLAFYLNTSLEEIVLPDKLVNIGESAFSGTNLTTVNIPASVTSIGAMAFSMPEDEKEEFNAQVEESKKIFNNYYYYSYILGNINFSTLKNGVTEINVDERNTVYSSENGILFNKDKTSLIAYPPGLTGEYTIPDKVNKIEECAFVGSKLSSVTVPASMKKIDKGAFKNSDIMTFVLSDGVESIDSEAFAYCRKLASFAFPLSLTEIGVRAFIGCPIMNIIIPASVTSLGDYSFGFYELNDEYHKLNDFTINGYSGSAAENYANTNKLEFVAYPICSHSNLKTLNEKKATCTEGGFSGDKQCTVCGLITEKGKEINSLGHEEEKIPAKEATCTEKGLTEGIKCSVCGEIIKAQEEIPESAHREEKIAGKSATCTEKGITDGVKCSVCGEVIKEQEEIPALGHKEVKIDGKSPTCTEKGLTDGKRCSVCDTVLEEIKEIPALGHTYKDGVCTVCGEIDLNYKLILKSDSKLILLEEKSMIIGIPENANGITAAEFKSQIDSDIKLDMDENTAIANGMTLKFGTHEYTVIIKGDVNADGKINASDARTILRIAAKLENPDEVTKESADINSDGNVTSKEARNVLRFAAKLQKNINE